MDEPLARRRIQEGPGDGGPVRGQEGGRVRVPRGQAGEVSYPHQTVSLHILSLINLQRMEERAGKSRGDKIHHTEVLQPQSGNGYDKNIWTFLCISRHLHFY